MLHYKVVQVRIGNVTLRASSVSADVSLYLNMTATLQSGETRGGSVKDRQERKRKSSGRLDESVHCSPAMLTMKLRRKFAVPGQSWIFPMFTECLLHASFQCTELASVAWLPPDTAGAHPCSPCPALATRHGAKVECNSEVPKGRGLTAAACRIHAFVAR